ncbi:hypothetical protein [Helicobacter pylori]|uniref:Uncharacterized protein n=4 Tax=Helicobacter pylori TaxID=210 RepID=A0A083YD81_HELPX|nr:hypothetical protein [Helicobacter pylori]KEY38760.1 hypothetical protein GZ76_07205 [Helicobacter pylori]KHL77101.1 hypothetical protein HPY1089_06795 [Helicobacter pylori]KHL78170.1 hypothetical protein HPY1152_04685 [Helicobacter pylori]KMT68376.1 hypothetical protein AB891_05635 [Helicobacter pylori]MBH0235856.1 hypothetical protein [Helicobacter pylori]
MNRKHRLAFLGLIVGVFFFFNACQHRLHMGYYSEVTGDYLFNYNSTIVVAYDRSDAMTSYYINVIVYELQKLGFYNVFTQAEFPLDKAKNVIYARIVRNISAVPFYQYNYQLIDQVNKPCYFLGGQFYCSQTPTDYYAINGFSEQILMSANSHFILDWYDVVLQKRVLYVDGSVSGRTCGYQMLYRDLIKSTIKRIDFNRPERYYYNLRLPLYQPCYRQ